MKKRMVSFCFAVVATLLMSACALPVFEITTQPVSHGYFASKGYRIVALDGSFALEGGKAFVPPFQNDMYGCKSCENYYLNRKDLLSARNLLAVGGKKVKVIRGKQALYGILVLNKVFMADSPTTSRYTLSGWNYSNPALRSYELVIPDARFDAAMEGRIEVVYEIFATVPAKRSATKKPRKALSWILLMSRTPI